MRKERLKTMIEILAQATGNINGEIVTNFISSLGFPIFVAVWLLYRSHKDNQVIKDAIDGLENAIIELNTYIKTLNDNRKVG